MLLEAVDCFWDAHALSIKLGQERNILGRLDNRTWLWSHANAHASIVPLSLKMLVRYVELSLPPDWSGVQRRRRPLLHSPSLRRDTFS